MINLLRRMLLRLLTAVFNRAPADVQDDVIELATRLIETRMKDRCHE